MKALIALAQQPPPHLRMAGKRGTFFARLDPQRPATPGLPKLLRQCAGPPGPREPSSRQPLCAQLWRPRSRAGGRRADVINNALEMHRSPAPCVNWMAHTLGLQRRAALRSALCTCYGRCLRPRGFSPRVPEAASRGGSSVGGGAWRAAPAARQLPSGAAARTSSPAPRAPGWTWRWRWRC